MSLSQIIYASQPFGFNEGVLDDILTVSRRKNAQDEITGALICRADMYLQYLEGPEVALEATYARICHDDRHLEINCLMSRSIDTRLFPKWAMRDDPARSWMWNIDEVAAGAITRATPAEVIAIFERLAVETG
jgi:Sensors of blue-light using FAD